MVKRLCARSSRVLRDAVVWNRQSGWFRVKIGAAGRLCWHFSALIVSNPAFLPWHKYSWQLQGK